MLLVELAKAIQQANPALKAFADMQGKPTISSFSRFLQVIRLVQIFHVTSEEILSLEHFSILKIDIKKTCNQIKVKWAHFDIKSYAYHM